jgi:sn-glycerol 3-phosphate transport system substrate-binding protein
MGVFPEARQQVEDAIEQALSGKKQPQQALDEAAEGITNKLSTYNKTVAK